MERKLRSHGYCQAMLSLSLSLFLSLYYSDFGQLRISPFNILFRFPGNIDYVSLILGIIYMKKILTVHGSKQSSYSLDPYSASWLHADIQNNARS